MPFGDVSFLIHNDDRDAGIVADDFEVKAKFIFERAAQYFLVGLGQQFNPFAFLLPQLDEKTFLVAHQTCPSFNGVGPGAHLVSLFVGKLIHQIIGVINGCTNDD